MAFLIRRVLLIVNPASRRATRLEGQAVTAFARAGVECEVMTTARPGHGAECARERGHAHDAVFTLGGDGTAIEVIGALAPDGPPVGLLAGGTGNLLVRALGIPLRIAHAVPALLAAPVTRIDLGRLPDGRRFAIGAGIGVDATMIQKTPLAWKRRAGVMAYVLTGTVAVLRQDRFVARVTVDGELLEHEASAVLVANFGALLHNFITLGDGIRHDDGVLNVCIFSPGTVGEAVRIGWKLVARDFRDDAAVTYRAGREVTIETDPPRAVQADGELAGVTPLRVVTEPGAGVLLVPEPVSDRGRRAWRTF